jgi:choline dehydrogenase-like flavoprotein
VNIVADWIDNAAKRLNIETFETPRGILSLRKDKRSSCYYSNFCGSYGCSSNAKSSSRVALLEDAIATGNCIILPNSKVFLLEESNSEVKKVHYYNLKGGKEFVEARITVVAAQAIESARLLLMSKSKRFPKGLGNNSGQVGKNLVFSAGGTGSGMIDYKGLSDEDAEALKKTGLFVNRATQEWYEIEGEGFSKKIKGGTVDFVFEHANGITKAFGQKYDEDRNLVYGSELKSKLKRHFTERRRLNFEIFIDWTPNDNCFVALDPKVIDKWGDPVAKVRLGYNKYDLKVGQYIADKSELILNEMGAYEIKSHVSGNPPSNLQAGGCRFGNSPKTSVLDKNCKSHEVENLYVTDGSFMPTGGSTTFTFTIYANSFRVADKIKERLDNEKRMG